MKLVSAILSAGLLFPTALWGFGESDQDQSPSILNENPLTVEEVTLQPEELEPGGVAELKIRFRLDDGHRAYLDQFSLDVVEPKDVFITEFNVAPLVDFRDPISKKIKKGATGYSTITTLVQLPSNISSGRKDVKMDMTFQACTDEYCLFPQKVPANFKFYVTGGGEALFTKTLDKGWLYALLVVFLAGILTSFTPCIFPLIPITLAVIGSRDTGGSKLRGFTISFSYVFGIGLTYAILGVVAAKTGALFGSLLGHPVVVGIIALLFILMGLSMYGLFEIKIPDKWATKLSGTKTDKGIIGAFLSGLIAGVVASPCVGPVLVSVLTYVAQTQDVVRGFVLLFVFALGLGQIFLILGTFSSLLDKLPKSGPWMDNVKFLFGTTMIAMALFYIYPVAHHSLFDGLVATSLILVATFFGAFDRLNKLSSSGRLRKALMMLIFMVGWIFAIKSLLPRHIEQQIFPASMSGDESSYPKPDWFKYSEASIVKAQQEGRPVILDFKAEWCLACKELEMYTFSDARVLELGEEFLWLDFDATHSSEELDRLKAKYGIKGLPHIVIYDSNGKHREDLTLTGFEDAEAFLSRMRKAVE